MANFDPQRGDDPYRQALLNGMRPRGGTAQNTGVTGAVPGAVPPIVTDQPMPPPQAEPVAPPVKFNTRLMEGDAGKLADAGHALESPKYAFLQAANTGKYNYSDLGKLLSDLQGDSRPEVASAFKGWSANGDKLTYGGGMSTLDPRWNGVTSVDTIGGFNDPNGPQGFRWGAEDPNQNARADLPAGSMTMAGGGADPMAALGALGNGSTLQKIQAALAQLMNGGQNG
jgi:hypothetical protein